jgi:GntR family transcriptional repressor for pyruvate dehydrogenase complex
MDNRSNTLSIVPVRNERLSDKVVNQILALIHAGELKPGQKLPSELVFSEQFAVSRGVIREAMIQLQALGYIRRKTKNGTFIEKDIIERLSKPVSDALKEATFQDLLDFRDSLESKMVEIVIDRASDERLPRYDRPSLSRNPNRQDISAWTTTSTTSLPMLHSTSFT